MAQITAFYMLHILGNLYLSYMQKLNTNLIFKICDLHVGVPQLVHFTTNEKF